MCAARSPSRPGSGQGPPAVACAPGPRLRAAHPLAGPVGASSLPLAVPAGLGCAPSEAQKAAQPGRPSSHARPLARSLARPPEPPIHLSWPTRGGSFGGFYLRAHLHQSSAWGRISRKRATLACSTGQPDEARSRVWSSLGVSGFGTRICIASHISPRPTTSSEHDSDDNSVLAASRHYYAHCELQPASAHLVANENVTDFRRPLRPPPTPKDARPSVRRSNNLKLQKLSYYKQTLSEARQTCPDKQPALPWG